jgi:hypothetical protein
VLHGGVPRPLQQHAGRRYGRSHRCGSQRRFAAVDARGRDFAVDLRAGAAFAGVADVRFAWRVERAGARFAAALAFGAAARFFVGFVVSFFVSFFVGFFAAFIVAARAARAVETPIGSPSRQ